MLSLLGLDLVPSADGDAVPASLYLSLALAQGMVDAGLHAPLWLATSSAVGVGRSDAAPDPRPAQLWGLGRVIALLLAWGLIWAAYGFQSSVSPDGKNLSLTVTVDQIQRYYPDQLGPAQALAAELGDTGLVPQPWAQGLRYTYFNATVGLLTAITMSGNFNSF